MKILYSSVLPIGTTTSLSISLCDHHLFLQNLEYFCRQSAIVLEVHNVRNEVDVMTTAIIAIKIGTEGYKNQIRVSLRLQDWLFS